MRILQTIKEEVLLLNSRQNLVLLVIIACFFQFALFYAPALADEAVNAAQAQSNDQEMIVSMGQMLKNSEMDAEAAKLKPIAALLVAAASVAPETASSTPTSASSTPAVKVLRTSTHTITAYNSEAGQTDDSPCITANGFNVCKHGEEDTIAANFLKFGTKVMIPELFGDRVFVVRDRMNKRHATRVDVWMNGKQAALKFGVKVAKIQVIE